MALSHALKGETFSVKVRTGVILADGGQSEAQGWDWRPWAPGSSGAAGDRACIADVGEVVAEALAEGGQLVVTG